MTQQCHFCGTVENLKAYVCGGHCPREQEHNTSICKNCYISKSDNPSQIVIEDWDKTTYHYKPKYKELNVDKMHFDIVHYYVDELHYSLNDAEEIAKKKIREQQELRGIKPT